MSQAPRWIGPTSAAPKSPARGLGLPAPRGRRLPPPPAPVAIHRPSRCIVALASAVLFGAAPAPLVAQKPRPKRPPAAAPADTTARRTDSAATAQDSLTRFLESFSLRNLGPAAYSGRVTALAVPHTTGPAKTLYIGAAGGGVWKTANGGSTWQPGAGGLRGGNLGGNAGAASRSNGGGGGGGGENNPGPHRGGG